MQTIGGIRKRGVFCAIVLKLTHSSMKRMHGEQLVETHFCTRLDTDLCDSIKGQK